MLIPSDSITKACAGVALGLLTGAAAPVHAQVETVAVVYCSHATAADGGAFIITGAKDALRVWPLGLDVVRTGDFLTWQGDGEHTTLTAQQMVTVSEAGVDVRTCTDVGILAREQIDTIIDSDPAVLDALVTSTFNARLDAAKAAAAAEIKALTARKDAVIAATDTVVAGLKAQLAVREASGDLTLAMQRDVCERLVKNWTSGKAPEMIDLLGPHTSELVTACRERDRL